MEKKGKRVIGICPLCGEERELVESHIVSKLVFAHIKQRGSGYLRSMSHPNRRLQDGPKPHLLCASCDNGHSASERAFNELIYTPLLEGATGPAEYGGPSGKGYRWRSRRVRRTLRDAASRPTRPYP
ncbi:hypothetical protein Dcar01_01118 [Deinococcus carri]|uniref:HNH endonuclease n=1 Tax=Deinococcus carri TaxID=1211323 RepID=A0ABP9W4Z0_9DEIO